MPHEDDVGDDAVVAVAVAVEDVFGKPYLDDDFTGGEVTVKARVAGGAEGGRPGAQPACEEMQRVPRSSSGMKTASMLLPQS